MGGGGVGLGGGGGGVRVDVNEELMYLGKFKKKYLGGGGVGCERRIEVFVKIQKKKFWGGGGQGGVGGRGRVGGGGFRVDVNKELKFL